MYDQSSKKILVLIKILYPQGLSALAPELYSGIKSCNLQTASSLKPLNQFSPDITWGLLLKEY